MEYVLCIHVTYDSRKEFVSSGIVCIVCFHELSSRVFLPSAAHNTVLLLNIGSFIIVTCSEVQMFRTGTTTVKACVVWCAEKM